VIVPRSPDDNQNASVSAHLAAFPVRSPDRTPDLIWNSAPCRHR